MERFAAIGYISGRSDSLIRLYPHLWNMNDLFPIEYKFAVSLNIE